jgi:hypothetical protein
MRLEYGAGLGYCLLMGFGRLLGVLDLLDPVPQCWIVGISLKHVQML